MMGRPLSAAARAVAAAKAVVWAVAAADIVGVQGVQGVTAAVMVGRFQDYAGWCNWAQLVFGNNMLAMRPAFYPPLPTCCSIMQVDAHFALDAL